MFRKLLLGLSLVATSLTFTACNNDDDYYDNWQDYYANNRGQVTFDGVVYNIKYVNLYRTDQVLGDGSRVYKLDLSTNYLNQNGPVYTDALFQADIFVPPGTTISGFYDMADVNNRTFNFAAYLEGVTVNGNQVSEPTFQIYNDEFLSRTMNLNLRTDNFADVEINGVVKIGDSANTPFNLWFSGYVDTNF